MPRKKEVDLMRVPQGFIGVEAAALIIGCNPEWLTSRRWVRRHALPALQMRRGWPIYFDEKKLREWCLKQAKALKPERRNDGPRSRAQKRKPANASARV